MIDRIRQVSELTGIVHAAGILDFCGLSSLDADRLQSSFKAKVDGAWNLHSKAQDSSFVLFSSVSALVGLPEPRDLRKANLTVPTDRKR